MKLRFSMAHFSVKQRRPFRNSFCPSLRHRRQTASRCLANFDSPFSKNGTAKADGNGGAKNPDTTEPRNSDAAALRRTAAVVGNRRDVANHHNVQTGGSESADGGFASRTGALHAHFDTLDTILVARDAGSVEGSLLSGVGRAFAGALETDGAGRGPAHSAAVGIGDGDVRVVERSGDVHDAVRHDAALAFFLEFFLALSGSGGFCRRCSIGRILRFFCHVTLRFQLAEIGRNPEVAPEKPAGQKTGHYKIAAATRSREARRTL